MGKVALYTIGFTKKSAEEFFKRLRDVGVRKLIDVRLNNVSQLAGFAKRDDLRFFLREICDCDYEHLVALAPTQEILDDYKKKRIDWIQYERRFKVLLHERAVERLVTRATLDRACLLCSEPTPEKCHRRLVAEHLREELGDIRIAHL